MICPLLEETMYVERALEKKILTLSGKFPVP